MRKPKILVVDDEPIVLMAIEEALLAGGFETTASASFAEAAERLAESAFDGLVTDIRLQPGSGWDLARAARDRHSDIAVIYVSGDSAAEWKTRGVEGSEFCQKPCAAERITTTMWRLVDALSPQTSSQL